MAKTATSKESSQPLSSPSLSLAVEETKGIPISFGDKVIGAVHGDEELIKKPLMMAKKKQKLGSILADQQWNIILEYTNPTGKVDIVIDHRHAGYVLQECYG
ncbi:hypothetical protein GH714_031546 [Hevea brasiliensis]|uniref:Uncharacterized protein n=1 Tax=Hevea brasiliensis TaxID=3981 RepID=A0A6A6M4M1_HEVBR|nr:hypothetical protein GH714_031546 [Hevea brasiliensis]